jgi:serine protease Do
MEKNHTTDTEKVIVVPKTVTPAAIDTVTHDRIMRRRKITVAGLIIIAICFFAGFGGARLYQMVDTNPNSITSQPIVKNDGNTVITKAEVDIASVVTKVSPSVVSIVTQSQTSSVYGGSTQQDGAGTGIIIGKDGYILTNKHVVNGATTVGVVLSDGTTYDNVKVIGTDPLNDIAIVKIPNVNNLPAAELGNSSSIRVGQSVVAIGNSLGQYQNTVTSGIISGTGRPISAQAGNSVENLTDLLQTDAAINPGNSGGPLLNLQGQVIGINTAIIQNAQGIGFAIPINATKGILKGVLAGGPLERAYVGLNYTPVTAEVAKYYSLAVKQGAYVVSGSSKPSVIAGSPAEKAGIKEKDIITQVNGVDIGSKGDLSSLVAEYAPGDTIELTVIRDGKTLTLKITLQTYKG